MTCGRPKSSPAILLVVVAGIGDFVMATPAIRTVRNGHPHAQLHLLTSSEAAAVARRHPGVDRVLAFPIREMRRSRWPLGAIVRVIRELRRTSYDIAANLYPVCSRVGSFKMAILFAALKAGVKAGHAAGWAAAGLDRKLPGCLFAGRHRVDAMMEVARAIGGRPIAPRLEMYTGDHREKWDRLVAERLPGRTGPRIGVNPGGDRANRRWPAARFAEVARDLAARCGASILVFGGPGEEAISRDIAVALNGHAVNLAGRLSLEELPYFLDHCDLLVTNDSGPMHMAAALQVPVVAIFGSSNAVEFGPYMPADRCRVIQSAVACRPCGDSTCCMPICLEAIPAKDVSAAAIELLNRSKGVLTVGS